jgi:glycoprotein endo-alpha-1,2-mannosidase
MPILRHLLLLTFLLGLGCSCQKDADPQPAKPVQVVKTNPDKVYMHYMPWFHTKEFSGFWGSHWRMANKNPETILPNGQREIASHYYPLIGPYDSGDPDVIDYHMLLMKYCGIDGVLIDWYGSHNVLDYGSNLENANDAIEGIVRTGLSYAIVYEDNTAEKVAPRKSITAIEAARQDMQYARNNYWNDPNYIKTDNQPWLLTFGPRYFIQPAQWSEILEGSDPAFYSLWYHSHRLGSHGAGEFAWVDFNASLEDLNHFYTTPIAGTRIGSAYAGFHDFYEQGGWGTSYGFVDPLNGGVLDQTLARFSNTSLNTVQLVTWNDFGEGTMLEPTVEFGFQFLETIQTFTGVTYTRIDLERIHTFYLKRKEYATDTAVQAILDDVFAALIQLDTHTADELLQQL